MYAKYYKYIIKKFVIVFMLLGCFFVSKNTVSPVVSVIMPVYNRSDFVSKAIESVLKQTYSNFELIIVDDGSKDDTLNIVQKYAQQDKRIKVFSLLENKGISYARNFAIAKAKGKYLATMDSDDQAYPDWLKISVNYMEKNPNVTIGFIPMDYYDDDGTGVINKKKYLFTVRQLVFSSIANIGFVYRMDFIKKNNIKYNETFISAEDYDFIAQIIMNNGRIEYVHPYQPLVLFRMHNSNNKEYYNKGRMNQAIVWKKLYQKNLNNLSQCQIAKQFIEKYPNAFNMFQKQLLMLEYCEEKPDKIFTVKHPTWQSKMFKSSQDSLMCFVDKTTSCAYIIQEEKNKITLFWELYGTKETFVLTSDGTYVEKSLLKK